MTTENTERQYKKAKSKLTRIPDETPVVHWRPSGVPNPNNETIRERILRELRFPEQAFHEVNKHTLLETRVADPIAFRFDERLDMATTVRIDFYATTYTVKISQSWSIKKACTVDWAESSTTFNFSYEQEKSNVSSIKLLKDYLVNTMSERTRKVYDTYYL